ncbi:hypothetical protein BGW36DRAFT_431097 [Talaromyces proteolyticus]|uniref:Uncharacterized protein n=1 Tax=Talaromyces proteolyticus TaxID=1131652 RepID=A0AAD4KN54_9EURO|nr:uncharacterized protein BGW36DRAFT_431097 [Talaromyces proteolyticus]KAH8691850.1 hypothetical protein BGW36DRAFT_431097 [Talaromyces proteolyticus]
MNETRRVSRVPHTLLDQQNGSKEPADETEISSTDGKYSKSKAPAKKASFNHTGSLASTKHKGVLKGKTAKLAKGIVRRSNESPWEAYTFVDEAIMDGDTVMKARKIVSGQIFGFRRFPLGEKFDVIEQQFQLLDHHNVLPAQEIFRHGAKGFIRSPVMDVSFARIVTCPQYPSSKALASMIGQTMDGLGYLVSNGIICNSLSCSRLLANRDGCVKIVAFADAEMQKDICAPTTRLVKRLAAIMILLMQKFQNRPGESGIQDSGQWPPQDEACKFLHELEHSQEFHRLTAHPFIHPKRRDGDGFKDLIEKTLDTTLEPDVRMTQDERPDVV